MSQEWPNMNRSLGSRRSTKTNGQESAKRRRWGARIHRSRHASTLYRGKPPETSNALAVWRKRSTRELGSDLLSHESLLRVKKETAGRS